MNFKIKMFKNIISVLCATVIATSGVVTSVGAIDEEKVNQILKNIDNCDNRIKDLEQNKARINEQKENEIKKLDSEIKDSEQLLEYLLNLINSGEDHKAGFDNVKRGIEDNQKKKKQITDDSEREINNLNHQTEIEKTEKAKLEKELDDLLKKQEEQFVLEKQKASAEKIQAVWKGHIVRDKVEKEEKEKFALEKKNASRVLGKYNKWLKGNNLSLKNNNLHKQLINLLAQANQIAKAANFDANAAREIVAKLGVVVKDVEVFKKDFEAKKKASVEKIQAVWKGHIVRDKVEKEARQRIEQISIALSELNLEIDRQKELVDETSPCYERFKKLSEDVFNYNSVFVLFAEDVTKENEHRNKLNEFQEQYRRVMDDLDKERKQEKEKFVLEKNSAFRVLGKYNKWLKDNKLESARNTSFEQLRRLLAQANEIAKADNFDAKEAREIVMEIGVAVKDVEMFKKDFEAKKKLEAMQKLFRRKANQAKDELHKKDKHELLDAIKEAAKEKQEKEKFVLEKKNAVKELTNYVKWLKQNGVSLKDDNLYKQLIDLLIQANKIAKANNFDAKAAHEIVVKLGVAVKDVEVFKKDFEVKKKVEELKNAKKLEAMQKLLERKANQENDMLERVLRDWNSKAKNLNEEAAKKRIAKWIENRYKTSEARKDWKKLKDGLQEKENKNKEDRRKLLNDIKKVAKEKKKQQAAINITDEKFEELLAGNQHVGNEREVNGKKWTIHNTCGIHMLTTLKNIYDYMDGKKEGPVRGFNNVIDNYLANGGTTDRLFAKNAHGGLGVALDSSNFKGFLEKNKIGMQGVSFYQEINVAEEAKKANKKEWDVVKDYKNKLKNQIKDFLVSYMKGKNFAPIGTVGGRHWTLLAKYDETTNQIFRLDSAPAKGDKEAKWVNLDKIAEKFISVDSWGQGVYSLNFEMPIFTRTEEIKDVQLDFDNFKEKQEEIIKRIG